MIWPQEVTLVSWTQPSGPLCLGQCLICYLLALDKSLQHNWRFRAHFTRARAKLEVKRRMQRPRPMSHEHILRSPTCCPLMGSIFQVLVHRFCPFYWLLTRWAFSLLTPKSEQQYTYSHLTWPYLKLISLFHYTIVSEREVVYIFFFGSLSSVKSVKPLASASSSNL